jgi:hypothetical protein
VLDGPRFLRSSQLLTGALVSDLNATVLAMAVALFPAINADRFGGSPRTLGLLTTALAVGGILGSGLSGPLSRVARQGRAMLLVVAGVADVSSVVLRTTIIQVATPDAYRGRTSAAEFVVGAACPELGNFRAGVVASLTSPGISALPAGWPVSGRRAHRPGASGVRPLPPEGSGVGNRNRCGARRGRGSHLMRLSWW